MSETFGPNPLHSAIAEQAVLGSMIRESSHVGEVMRLIKRDAFYIDAHQRVFQAIADLHEAQKPIDSVSVADRLHAQKQIGDIGGYGYLGELVTAAGTGGNLHHYCETVLNYWKRRELVRVAAAMARDAHDCSSEADEILAKAEREIVQLSEQGTSEDILWLAQETDTWLAAIDDLSDRRRNGEDVGGLPTGFIDLDRRLGGGFYPSELIILAARPGIGKTALGLSIAYRIASRVGKAVGFFSLEQHNRELMNRLGAAFGGVDGVRLREGSITAKDAERIQTVSKEFRKTELAMIDRFHQSILSIAANARRLKRKNDIGVIVVDYLQLVTPESTREQRHEQVAGMSRRLKALARELEIPVVCLAQINRQNQTRADAKPRMSDLRESGAIEQDADIIMLMHRPNEVDENQPREEIQVIIDKNRHGPIGIVSLMYEKALMQFSNKMPD